MDVFDHDHSLFICAISTSLVHAALEIYVIIYLPSRYRHFVERQYHRLYPQYRRLPFPLPSRYRHLVERQYLRLYPQYRHLPFPFPILNLDCWPQSANSQW
ncbi:hypothetical protein BYT27DRAFT_6931539 [Phlegmacium glaucopus]|nr:hypothetical protein BYT27DRAFT_6931539 [Phlegmacium glaucopus]